MSNLWKEVGQAIALLQQVLSQVVGLSAGGVGLGYLMNRYLGLPRATMIVTGILGLSLAIYRIYRMPTAQNETPKPPK